MGHSLSYNSRGTNVISLSFPVLQIIDFTKADTGTDKIIEVEKKNLKIELCPNLAKLVTT